MPEATPTLQPEAMSDEQLIEAVAVEVMGWTMQDRGEKDMPLEVWVGYKVSKSDKSMRSEIKYDCNQWNPLTDWNATMEVRQKMHELGREFNWRSDVTHHRREHEIQFSWCYGFDHESPHTLIEAKDPQRAICLAALHAVRSLDK